MKSMSGVALGSLMIVGGFALACLPPGQRLVQVVRERWTAVAAKESKPEVRVEEELSRSETRLRESVTQLAERGQRLRDDQREAANRARALKARECLLSHLLDQFREAFQRAEREGKSPVVVMGQVYEREQLREQVTVLLRERDEVLADQQGLASLQNRLQETESDCVAKLRETRRHLEAMPTYANLLTTGKLLDQSRTQLQAMRDVLEQNSVFIQKNPIRSVKELLVDVTRLQSQGTALNQVDQFLKVAHEPARQAGSPDGVGDVRVTDTLRSLNELLQKP